LEEEVIVGVQEVVKGEVSVVDMAEDTVEGMGEAKQSK